MTKTSKAHGEVAEPFAAILRTIAPAAPGDGAKAAPTALMKAIDELGIIKAEAATLAEREKALKAVIEAAGVGGHDGELFHANVSESERSTRDADFKEQIEDLIAENISPQYARAHTNKITVTTIKVTARSAALVAAGKAGRS